MKAIRSQLANFLAAAVWVLLSGGQVRAASAQRSLFPLLLAAESGMIAFLLLNRRSDEAKVPFFQKIVAWLSVGLPLAFETGNSSPTGQALAFAGVLVILWGLATLGRSFGIAPADRGLIAVGPYRFIRHPMYAGALLVALGALLSLATRWNCLVFGSVCASAGLRIHWEEHTLRDYARYARAVRWRLVPGVW